MNAKEFIKKFGWEKAISVRNDFCDGFYLFSLADGYVDRIAGFQLSEYIDAYELVKLRGGLSEAKAIEQQYWNSGVGSAMIVSMELKQAIALVEEINA